VKRRDFLKQSLGAGILSSGFPFSLQTTATRFQFADVTAQSGINFRHTSGAYGGKLLPETLGSGCAFLDYDADGWPDILLINSMDWPGHKRQRSALKLYRNNRNGTFTDVTKSAGLDLELYGMGVAVADYDEDGHVDIVKTNFSDEECLNRFAVLSRTGAIYFRPASARLDAQSRPLLQEVEGVVGKCPGLKVEVSGHTDSDGSPEANKQLSERRAQAVADALIAAGVPGKQISAAGYGEERPVAANDTPKNKALNRRIEFSASKLVN